MRKSNMTRAIQLEIHKRLGSHSINTNKIAEKVLDKILELGMLPPITIDGSEPIRITYLNDILDDMDMECGWQPENDSLEGADEE